MIISNPRLIPFILAGYPNLATTEAVLESLATIGVTTVELGVPFSDPVADGPIIQKASESVAHIQLAEILQLVSRFHARYPKLQIVIFSYLNPLLAMGLNSYVRLAKQAGVTATLTVDLPPEEAEEYCRLHKSQDLKTVFLASPSTSPERLNHINACSTGFVYYVSRAGVTGEQQDLSATLPLEVNKIRQFVNKPLAVGFGISNAKQAAQVAQFADAVVIGSTFVRLLGESKTPEQACQKVSTFASNCLKAIAEI